MLDCLMLLRLFCHSFLLLNSFADISAAQDACIYRSGAMLVNPIVVVKHTIHIITSVPHNTTFQVNTDLTVTVDNAPTSLGFLTTYFSTSTAIDTMNGSVSPFSIGSQHNLKGLTQSKYTRCLGQLYTNYRRL